MHACFNHISEYSPSDMHDAYAAMDAVSLQLATIQ